MLQWISPDNVTTSVTEGCSLMQRCSEADAAVDQLRQHANSVGGQEAQSIMQQLITQIVTEQDKQRQAHAKVGTMVLITALLCFDNQGLA